MNYPGEPRVSYDDQMSPDPEHPLLVQTDLGGKYVIFKSEDWRRLVDEIGRRFTDRPDHVRPILKRAVATMVQDGVVIRRQDTFSPAPLHMYQLMIESTIEALKKQPGGYNEEYVRHLQSRADYFHEEAMRAEEENYKIPD